MTIIGNESDVNDYDPLDFASDDEGKKDIELCDIENGEIQKKYVS